MIHRILPALLAACALVGQLPALPGPPPEPREEAIATQTLKDLSMENAKHGERSLTVNGTTIRYRAYEGLVYVAKPVDATHQCLNLYIPSAYFEKGGTLGGYAAETAPIFLPNRVGGYMPALPGNPTESRRPGPPGGLPGGSPPSPGLPEGRGGSERPIPPGPPPKPPEGGASPNAIAIALSRGFVVASPGARGRTLRAADGSFTGKAPAAIVDLKAAVRFLRHNRRWLRGDTGRIISNGTSAGGALSALLGASGNHRDYEPWLRALGAAEERDDIFAASCYCPISNLDHADSAYEWLFHGLNDYNSRGRSGTMTAGQIAASAKLKAMFPAYLNGLKLSGADGRALTLDADGVGSFVDELKSHLIASAQAALARGAKLSPQSWITVEQGRVKDLDFDAYRRFASRMKPAPAFDALDLSAPENDLFGSATKAARHFTAFSAEQGADPALAEPDIVRLMNPMELISARPQTTSPHWRIRHGAVDRDTSLAIPVLLAASLRRAGRAVDFAVPWGQGHGGDYDLDELFAWMASIAPAAPR